MGRDDELLLHLRAAVRRAPVERPRWDPVALETAPPLRLRRRSKLVVGAAVASGLLVASTGLAAAGALPDPAQHVAHEVLGSVGVDVPDPERYHGPECGETVGRNHGAYVSEDPALARSDCGKPVNAVTPGSEKPAKSAKADDGDPCTGPPPWAGNDELSEAEVAAAKAAHAAECGTEAEAEASASRDAGPTTTEPTATTVAEPTTAPPTTEAPAPSTPTSAPLVPDGALEDTDETEGAQGEDGDLHPSQATAESDAHRHQTPR